MYSSVDADQRQHSAASDLGLYCLQRPIPGPILRVIWYVVGHNLSSQKCTKYRICTVLLT